MTQDNPDRPRSHDAPPVRTPEQQAAVRRRALPVAVAGVILAVAGIFWPLLVPGAVLDPPNIYAVNIAFCAILIGAGILFYARGTSGTRIAAVASVLAIVLGIGGTLVYAMRYKDWHQAMEETDLGHVEAIAKAAAKYAAEHGGAYPTDLRAMLEGKYLDGAALLSPFGGAGSEYLIKNQVPLSDLATVAAHADYSYTGAGLKAPLNSADAKTIIVVYETEPVMRVQCAMAFADGSSAFLTQDSFTDAVTASHEARRKAGFPEPKEPGRSE